MKNQFRSLDEDEIEFLDSVLESTRAEEERVKRETREGLEAFRKQQEEADKKSREAEGRSGVIEGSPVAEEEQWVAGGRKRKRKAEKEVLKGVKLRRASSSIDDPKAASPPTPTAQQQDEDHKRLTETAPEKQTELKSKSKPTDLSSKSISPTAPSKPGLGLVNYGSDEDDW